jgi:hypothetical protein
MSNLPRLLPRAAEARVRSRRIDLVGGLTVESRTIGTPMSFVLGAANLSRTGLLTQMTKNVKVPYRVNTLVELTIDPAGTLFERPVECLAKVVRIARAADTTAPKESEGYAYGMHIVQMDADAQSAWERCIGELEGEMGSVEMVGGETGAAA